MICYERYIPDQPPLWADETPTLRFVLKLHHATRLHHDFRLEAHGVLISWALPEILDLGRNGTVWARQVGDHDPQYMLSERRIPPGQYGAGPMLVRLWARGVRLWGERGCEEGGCGGEGGCAGRDATQRRMRRA